MKNFSLLFLFIVVLYSCSEDSSQLNDINGFIPSGDEFDWIVPSGNVNGSGIPFALAKDPVFSLVKNTEFIGDESLVAVISMDDEIRVYPYQYMIPYESINDKINERSYSMTYCPLTQSTVVINRDFQNENFILRASGYLLHDNVVLIDEVSQSFWSQMLVKCIKGPYSGQYNTTFNFVEMPWKTVTKNFPEAKVLTNTSISNENRSIPSKKKDVKIGDLVYGIILSEFSKEDKVYIFHYDDFDNVTELKKLNNTNQKILIIGNKNEHFITSYINDSDASFEALQDAFPIVMKDSDNNKWNVFGTAVSGPRTGDQLDSHTAFFALFGAWEKFYNDFIFVE